MLGYEAEQAAEDQAGRAQRAADRSAKRDETQGKRRKVASDQETHDFGQQLPHPNSGQQLPYLCLVFIIRLLMRSARHLRQEIKKARAENLLLRQENLMLRTKGRGNSAVQKSFWRTILKNDRDASLFTGIPTKNLFTNLHKAIAPLIKRRWLGLKRYVKYCLPARFASNKSGRKTGPDRKLSSEDEFLLSLMKLRLGLQNFDLAH